MSFLLDLVSPVAISPALVMASTAIAPAPPTIPTAAYLLPENIAYVVLLDTREPTWEQLKQFALFQELETQLGEPINPGSLIFLPSDLDYRTDISPWVGDKVAIALLPLAVPEATKIEEHEVLIAPIAQPAAFTGFVDKVTELRGTAPAQQRYREVPILYWEPEFLDEAVESPPALPVDPTLESSEEVLPIPPPLEIPELGPPPQVSDNSTQELQSVPPAIATAWKSLKALPEEDPELIPLPPAPLPDVPGLAIAVLPEFLVVAAHPAAVRAWLDLRPRTPTESSLATAPRFLGTLSHPAYDEALGAFYGNVGEILKYSLTDTALPDLPVPLPFPDTLSPAEIAEIAALELDSTVEVLLYPTSQGIRLQGRSYSGMQVG
jgi:hypothetical protein